MALTEADHRGLGVGYFTSAWELADRSDRTPELDREMLARAAASRQHWREADATAENLAVADWQVAHVASLAGFADVARAFARAAYDLARSADLPRWLQASTAEGMARACAVSGDADGFRTYAEQARALLAAVDDDEDRAVIETQLAAIPAP